MGKVGRRDTGVPQITMGAAPSLSNHQGFALVAALLLLAVVGIVTATVLQTTSTEIQISGNHRQAVQEFYAAEAGLAEARSRLRKSMGAEDAFIGSPGVWQDPSWTAYIVTSADWSPADDPDYSTGDINVFPVMGNAKNTIVQPNSVQTNLPYWLKLRHKTEFDAEQAGHHTTTPHYLDQDGSTARHNTVNRGNIIYFGYPSQASSLPVPFTTPGTTPWLPVQKVVARGSTTGRVVLEEEVVHLPGPNQVGALYASGNVSLSGPAGVINGHDACGMVNSLPPVLAGGTVTSTPSVQFHGNPASPQASTLALDLEGALADLSVGALALTEDQTNQQLGHADAPMVVFANGASFVQPEGIRIRQTSGSGILLVDGNATLEDEVQWDGMILVTGTLFSRGQGSGIVVHGGVWAGQVSQQSGPVDVTYDSCLLQAALLAVPTRVRTWKEVL